MGQTFRPYNVVQAIGPRFPRLKTFGGNAVYAGLPDFLSYFPVYAPHPFSRCLRVRLMCFVNFLPIAETDVDTQGLCHTVAPSASWPIGINIRIDLIIKGFVRRLFERDRSWLI